MKVSDRLSASVGDLFDTYVQHPFVQGIGGGTLDKEKFQYYMIQDYLYLIDYARVFSIGAAKAQDTQTMRIFAAYVNSILSGEMDIHRGYMKRLGISLEEAEKTPVALDNCSYTSYMIRTAYEGGAAEVTAAILSCAVSYEDIAKKLAAQYPQSPSHPFYGEWVSGYISDEYHRENEELKELMDRLADGYSEQQIRHLEDIFRTCSRYEGAFWDMAWEMRR